jgi:hypothetical protein
VISSAGPRQHEGELFKDAVPVEATLGETGDGRRTLLLDGPEVGERGQAVHPGRLAVELLRQARLIGLAVIDLLARQRHRDDPEQEQGQARNQDVDHAAGPKRSAIATTLVGGDEVDGPHQSIANP